MPCDTARRPNQTVTERKEEILAAVVKLNGLLARGLVTPKIGPQGAILFQGWGEADRGRVTDACAYRRLMATGGSLAKAAIARAEQMAGRSVSKQAVAVGAHSHDNGETWHSHKG